ncbi:hypothetical protein [Nesterenkonia alkaliphila]|uniref:Uncharacterized protein n=1 Tax=Nesterenkonia alkaliphila TaxID=1463631 RepID=A0A7K1UKP8_9MICC|nr:hypothetical protein [Nesterenkonia alkaliphila]MVT27065.1 hypothetical protein [Nesterenkonia alkaliphila]GFZ98982.1 hypothetical protein GCM10011359_30050 [Nesterenkonia alkaliphila]
MATRVRSQAEIDRIKIAANAAQQMAGADEAPEDIALRERVLRGERTAGEAIEARLAELKAQYGAPADKHRMAVQDPYAYPGTDVLINIPGFTDPEGWKKAETAVQALEHDPRPHNPHRHGPAREL